MTNPNHSTPTNVKIVAMEKLLRRMAKLTGDDSLGTAVTALELAEIHKDKENYDRALELYEKAEPILRQTAADSKNSQLAAEWTKTQEWRAFCYLQLRQPETAAKILEMSLAGWTKAFGESHPFVLTIMNNLAICYRDGGQVEKSILLYEKTLSMAAAQHGTKNNGTLIIVHNLAMAYCKHREYDKAIRILQDAMRDIEFAGDDQIDQEVKDDIRRTLAMCHLTIGNRDEAMRLAPEMDLSEQPPTMDGENNQND